MLTHLMLTGVLMVAQAQGSGTIEGVVREHGRADGPGLAFATLEVSAPGELRSAMADSLGAYRIEGLAAGLVRLRVSHLGYASARVDVEVPPGGMISLDVDLERRPIEMELLEVTGDPLAPPDVTPGVAPPRPEVEVIALAASPGLGEAGLGEAVAALPGNDPADPSDVLFMRGSTTDLKLVLLDGAPVYTPFHLRWLAQHVRRLRARRCGPAYRWGARTVRRRALVRFRPPHAEASQGPLERRGSRRFDQWSPGPRGSVGRPSGIRSFESIAARSGGCCLRGGSHTLRVS